MQFYFEKIEPPVTQQANNPAIFNLTSLALERERNWFAGLLSGLREASRP